MRWSTSSAACSLLLAACGAGSEPVDAELVAAPEQRAADSIEDRKRTCIATAIAGIEPRFAGLVRSVCAEWVNQSIPGLAVAVVERDRVVLHLELGVRCATGELPVTAETSFRVGSISKAVTASIAVATLDLDAPAELAGLQWPQGMTAPTVRALLSHRSGLGEIDPAQLVALDGKWIPALARGPVGGPAGEFRYSNAGYIVVGALIEQALGRDYDQLLPASLTSDPTKATAPACGHLANSERWRAVAMTDDLDFMPAGSAWLRPAGGVIASASQLARSALHLDARLFDVGEPIPAPAWRRPGIEESYALGLRSWRTADGQSVFGHSGLTGNFAAELILVPERELSVALLANAPMDWAPTLAAIDQMLAGD